MLAPEVSAPTQREDLHGHIAAHGGLLGSLDYLSQGLPVPYDVRKREARHTAALLAWQQLGKLDEPPDEPMGLGWMSSTTTIVQREDIRRQRLISLEQTERTMLEIVFDKYAYTVLQGYAIPVAEDVEREERDERHTIEATEGYDYQALSQQFLEAWQGWVTLTDDLAVVDYSRLNLRNGPSSPSAGIYGPAPPSGPRRPTSRPGSGSSGGAGLRHHSTTTAPLPPPQQLRSGAPATVGTPLLRSTPFISPRVVRLGHTTAFERFRMGLHTTLLRIGGGKAIDEKWDMLTAFLDAFFPVMEAGEGAGAFQRSFQSTSPPPSKPGTPTQPDPGSVSLACAVLDLLLLFLVRIQPALGVTCQRLRTELHRAIFQHPRKVEAWPPTHVILADVTALDTLVTKFMDLPKWFSVAEDCQRTVHRVTADYGQATHRTRKLQNTIRHERESHGTQDSLFRRDLSSLQGKLESRENTLNILEEENEKMHNANRRLQGIQERLTQENDALLLWKAETQLREMDNQVKMRDLEQRMDETKQALEEARHQCEEHERVLWELPTQDQVDALQKTITSLETQLKEEKERQRVATVNIERERQKLVNSERDHQKALATLRSMQGALDDTRKELQDEASTYQVRLGEERQRLGAEVQREQQQWHHRQQELEHTTRRQEDELQRMKDEFSAAMEQLGHERGTKEAEQRECARLQEAEVKHREEQHRLASQLKEYMSREQSLQQQLADLHETCDSQRQRTEETIQKLGELQSDQRKREAIVEEERQRAQQRDAEQQRRQLELASRVKELEATLEELRRQARIREAEHDIGSKRLGDRERRVEELEREIERLRTVELEHRTMQYQLADKGLQIQRMTQNISEQRKRADLAEGQAMQVPILSRANDELRTSLDELRQERYQLETVFESLLEQVAGTTGERRQRRNASKVLAQTPDVTVLLAWANTLLQGHVIGHSKPLGSFRGGAATLPSYLWLIHILAPLHLSEEECREVLQRGDATEQGALFMKAIKRLGVPPHITEEELLREATEVQHVMLLNALFSRFCDSSKAFVHQLPPLHAASPPGTSTTTGEGGGQAERDEDGVIEGESRVSRYGRILQDSRAWRGLGEKTQWCAESYCLERARNKPQSVWELIQKGSELRDKGQHQSALHCYSKAIEMDGKSADAYVQRGLLRHHHLKDYTDALVDYDRVLDLHPQWTDVLRHRAELKLSCLQDFSSALEDFTNMVKMGHRDAQTFVGRGQCLQALGDHSLALEDFETALRLQPGHLGALSNRDSLLPIAQVDHRNRAEQALLRELNGLPPVQFQRNKSTLNASGYAAIDVVARVLEQSRLAKARIVAIATNKAGLALAKKRSHAVVLYLTAKGIDQQRLEYKARPGRKPATLFEIF